MTLEKLVGMFAGQPGDRHTIEVSLTDVREWRAEIERLRAALKIIAKMPDWTGQGAGWAAKVAQHALEQNGDG